MPILRALLGALLFGVASGLSSLPATAQREAAQSADAESEDGPVILVYHRFGESALPSTSVRIDQFKAHLAYLKSEGFQGMSLGTYVAARNKGEHIPAKTVIFTVDDAYASFAERGWPLLREAGFPATVFAATDPIDNRASTLMSWDQLRALAADGVEVGHHSAAHLHYNAASDAQIKDDLARADGRFRQELGFVPDMFAYPYGEFSTRVTALVKAHGFRAAAAQYSAAPGGRDDLFVLPRFPVNERYGAPERFSLVTATRPIAHRWLAPSDALLSDQNNPPVVQVEITEPGLDPGRLTCFPSHIGRAAVTRVTGTTLSVVLDKAFPKGRSRINCTVRLGNRWGWIGLPFFVPTGLPPDQGY